jgi:hypothetical protein
MQTYGVANAELEKKAKTRKDGVSIRGKGVRLERMTKLFRGQKGSEAKY